MKKVPLCASSKRIQSAGGTMGNCTYCAVGSSKLGATSLSHSLLSDLRSPKQCQAQVSFAMPLISVSNNFMKDTSQPSRVPSLTSPWVCLLSVSLLTLYAHPRGQANEAFVYQDLIISCPSVASCWHHSSKLANYTGRTWHQWTQFDPLGSWLVWF